MRQILRSVSSSAAKAGTGISIVSVVISLLCWYVAVAGQTQPFGLGSPAMYAIFLAGFLGNNA